MDGCAAACAVAGRIVAATDAGRGASRTHVVLGQSALTQPRRPAILAAAQSRRRKPATAVPALVKQTAGARYNW